MVQFALEVFSGSEDHSNWALILRKYTIESMQFLENRKWVSLYYHSINEQIFKRYLFEDHQIIDCSGLLHVQVGRGPPTFPTEGGEWTVEAMTDWTLSQKEMTKVSDEWNEGLQCKVLLHWFTFGQTTLPERCGLVGYMGELLLWGLIALKALKGSESDSTMEFAVFAVSKWVYELEDYTEIFSLQ